MRQVTYLHYYCFLLDKILYCFSYELTIVTLLHMQAIILSDYASLRLGIFMFLHPTLHVALLTHLSQLPVCLQL